MNFPTKTNMSKRQYHYVTPRLPGPNKPAFSFWSNKRPRVAAEPSKPPKVDMAKVQAALEKLGR